MRTEAVSSQGEKQWCGLKSELKMFGCRQEPTWRREQRAGKINCGYISEGIKCQANEFGVCS